MDGKFINIIKFRKVKWRKIKIGMKKIIEGKLFFWSLIEILRRFWFFKGFLFINFVKFSIGKIYGKDIIIKFVSKDVFF